MDLTCYILIALGLVLGFIGGWSLWFAVVRYWERRAKQAEGRVVLLEGELSQVRGDYERSLQRMVAAQFPAKPIEWSSMPQPDYDAVINAVHGTMRDLYGTDIVLLLLWLPPNASQMDLATNADPKEIVRSLRQAADRIEAGVHRENYVAKP